MKRWQGSAAVAAGVAMTALLSWVSPLQGRADLGLVAYLLGAAAYLGTASLIEGRRSAVDHLFRILVRTSVGICIVALGAVLIYTTVRGLRAINPAFFTHSMSGVGPRDLGGGAYHAVLGTLEQVFMASAMAVPTGLVVAIYLNEYGRGKLASIVRALIDMMVGIPSVVAGLFIYTFWVLGLHQGFSGLAAAMALSILMLPVVVRSAEEMMQLVPAPLREASYALGVPRWRTILGVVLPTASAGITTGVVLAVARVAGETAPVLLTAFGFDAIHTNPVHGPQSSLPLFVFSQASSAFDAAVDRAWAGALTLVVVVLLLTVTARLLAARNRIR